jgi:hypothetical protein
MENGYIGVDGRIILKRNFKMWDGEARAGLLWLRIGTAGLSCERSNELSGFHNMREIFGLAEELLAPH